MIPVKYYYRRWRVLCKPDSEIASENCPSLTLHQAGRRAKASAIHIKEGLFECVGTLQSVTKSKFSKTRSPGQKRGDSSRRMATGRQVDSRVPMPLREGVLSRTSKLTIIGRGTGNRRLRGLPPHMIMRYVKEGRDHCTDASIT
jgi:hypothetical protein